MYNNGMRVAEISKLLHHRSTYVSDILKKNGIAVVKGRSKNRNLDHEYFNVINSQRKAYFLGLLFADGSVTLDNERSPSIRLELQEQDIDILHTFKNELNIDGKLYHRTGRVNTYTVNFRSKEIADALSKYGIVPNKTILTKHLPSICEEYTNAFIHGLIDGDGSIYYSENAWHINFCSHFKSICEEFENICTSIIGGRHMTVQCSNNVYRVTYNGYRAIQLANAINTECGIERKSKKILEVINTVKDIV